MPEKIKKILYIEDDANCRILIKKIIEQHGYKLFEAEDGFSGLELAKNNNFDLILLDINMIGMNGFEIATKIKSFDNCKNIPLIAITGNLLNNTKDMSIISGCDGFLTKPINAATIMNSIEEYLNGKRDTLDQNKIPELMKEYSINLVSHLEQEIKELKRANADLKEIDKLKSDFISLASHELRTPLVTIIGYISLLLSKRLGSLSPEHEKLLNIVERNARRLEKIIKDMFTISLIENKIPFMELRNINPVNIIETVLEDLDLAIKERKLNTNFKIDGNIPTIECDEERIMQVVSNIIRNAIKFTENNGNIDITIRYPSVKISERYGLAQTDYIEIIVEDTGIGIPPDKINKVFEKFIELAEIEKHHTSDKDFMGGGIGLGLSICLGIVQRHNGYIWAENRETKGTRLIIILPLKVSDKFAFIDQ
jgi:signal transduction histidine kinase